MRTILFLIFFVILSNAAVTQIDSLRAYSIHSIGKTVSSFPPVSNAPGTFRICTPSKSQLLHSAMIIIFSGSKIIFKSDTLIKGDILSNIPPDAIETVNVLKGPEADGKYGGMAKNGVIEFYLKDGKYPDIYKLLKIDSARKKSK